MAEKKMTRAAAMTAIVEFAKSKGFEDEAVLTKLDEVMAQWNKPRKIDDSKKIENVKWAKKIAETMGKEQFTNADACEKCNLPFINSKGKVSSQKVNAILAAGVSEGVFTKSMIGGKLTVYQVA